MFLCLLMLKELNEQANNSNYNNVNNTAALPPAGCRQAAVAPETNSRNNAKKIAAQPR